MGVGDVALFWAFRACGEAFSVASWVSWLYGRSSFHSISNTAKRIVNFALNFFTYLLVTGILGPTLRSPPMPPIIAPIISPELILILNICIHKINKICSCCGICSCSCLWLLQLLLLLQREVCMVVLSLNQPFWLKFSLSVGLKGIAASSLILASRKAVVLSQVSLT
jgi:hypothetical protein